MLVYLCRAWLLLAFLNTTQVVGQNCPSNFFGAGCKTRCNCPKRKRCNRQGICPNNQCMYHFFGPLCQYVDILSWNYDSYVPSYFYDDNPRTCNSDSNSSFIEVGLLRKAPFTWFRVVVDNPSKLTNFTTSFNTGQQCWNEKKYVVNSNTVDVTCDVQVLLVKLRIEGDIVPHVCDIFISAGRNLALRQETWQTSNHEQDLNMCGSSNAVDGDGRNKYEFGTCTRTQVEPAGSEWGVRFSNPAVISVINIINRNVYQSRLSGLEYRMFDVDGNLDSIQIINKTQFMYELTSLSITPISYATIKQSTRVPIAERALTICEVEIYGDQVCPDDTYGVFCEGKCLCDKTEACNFVTGACAPGCPPGLYGFNCSQTCSPHCVPKICNFFSGSCYPCVDGYVGDNCNKECLPGTFGAKWPCLNCSGGCRDICNKTTGYCTCMNGYLGLQCTECVSGTYGETFPCLNCSVGCSDICNTTTGYCRCTDKYTGLRCNECREGTFGTNCQSNCSIGCADICDSTNGVCTCNNQFQGLYCTDPICPETTYGFLCDQNCSCKVTEKCDSVTGACSPGCPPGLYGINCSSRCSENCLYGVCYYRYGECLQCIPGYFGYWCNQECRPGTFGANCQAQCSIGCTNICNITNGVCTCNNQFQGLDCSVQICPETTYGLLCDQSCSCNVTEKCHSLTGDCSPGCPPGLYGINCSSRCNKNCLYGVCYYQSGKCLHCIPGYVGSWCNQKCRPGTFGANCHSRCSIGCTNICNNTNGVCTCNNKFQGLDCSVPICPEATYGLLCDKRCTCNVTEICNSLTGVCSAGCKHGLYGINCSSRCSENCLYRYCNYRYGKCVQCTPGYVGSWCNQECHPGTFGSKCQSKCSIGCANLCNKTNGYCKCKNTFKGLDCSECRPGTFGSKCQSNCSKDCIDTCNTKDGRCNCKTNHIGHHCLKCSRGLFGQSCDTSCPQFCYKKLCNRSTGECLACMGNRSGSHCQECNATFYGLHCELYCSTNCLNETCNHLTGHCTACKKGFKGTFCFYVVEKPIAWVAPFSLIPFLFLLFIFMPEWETFDDDDDSSLSESDSS